MELFKSDKQPNNQAPQKGKPQTVDPAHISKEIIGQSRKIRINEERALALRKKIQVIEHNMLITQKRFLSEVKFINEEISDMKREFDDIKNKLLEFARELQRSAKKDELMVLEKYINMWEPINFVTRNELQKILDERLGEK